MNINNFITNLFRLRSKKKKLPVTVLSGFLGSGKTTILKNILNNNQNLKVAVIVNDLSELNIDALIIENQTSIRKTEDKMIQLSNGCICCTLREDLIIEVNEIVKQGGFDYLIIESTGVSEPIPVAQSFVYKHENLNFDLIENTILDTMVTVVDAFNFDSDFNSSQQVEDRESDTLDEKDKKSIVQLLTDQIEFANVIVLNKIDLISGEEKHEIIAKIHALNPDAKIIECQFGNFDFSEILNTRLFDFEKTSHSAGWIKELQGVHVPETESYGISSFIFEDKRPFNADRLNEYIFSKLPQYVYRSKGIFWTSNRPDDVQLWSQSGKYFTGEYMNTWWAAKSDKELKKSPYKDEILKKWDDQFGDRHNQIVIIGQNINKDVIISDFQKCLCTKEEIASIFRK